MRKLKRRPESRKIIHKHHPGGRKNDPQTVEKMTVEEHAKEHNITPNSPNPKLRTAYKEYKFWQTEAGRMERMIGSYRGEIKNTTPSPYVRDEQFADMEERLKVLRQKEKESKKTLTGLVHETPEWKGFMKDAPCMGEITAGMFLSYIKIELADTVSSLWSYLGYKPNGDGKRLSNPGLLNAFHAPLYAALKIALERKDGLYRHDYEVLKAQMRKKNPKRSGESQAVYRLTKLWLSLLWATWREWAGLPTALPYVNNHLHHDNYIKAEERGWKVTMRKKPRLLKRVIS